MLEDMQGKVRVHARLRPVDSGEVEGVSVVDEFTLVRMENGDPAATTDEYAFDHAYAPTTSNTEVKTQYYHT